MNKIVFYNLFCFTLSWDQTQRHCKFMYYFPSGQYVTKSIGNILKSYIFTSLPMVFPVSFPEEQVMWLYN